MKLEDNPSDRRKRRELLISARMGVREAQYALGLMYVNGAGGEQDVDEAVSWISQAAEKGLPAAQYVLGARYAAGLMGGPGDQAAYSWFSRAAEQGHPRAIFRMAKIQETAQPGLASAQLTKAAQLGLAEAQLALGKAHATGHGVTEDPAAAFMWMHKAADQGLAAAQHQLAGMHAEGLGTPADLEHAIHWYRKAASQDHPPAIYALAGLDVRGVGRGAEPQPERSALAAERRRDGRRWLTAADPGDADSRFYLGQMFELGIGAPCDVAKARSWYSLAARQDDARAQAALARLLEQAGDADAAVPLYQQAAALGERSAQVALGRLHSSHDGDPQKAFNGVLWYSRAAEGGDPLALLTLAHLFLKGQEHIAHHCFHQAAVQGVAQAQYMLGHLYESGSGVSADAQLAAEWYRRAAEQGEAQAQCALGICHLAGHGVAKSAATALRWLLAASEQGDAKAQWNLSALHASGGDGVPQNLQQAFFWCHRSADQGYLAAQATLGLLYARIDQPQQAVTLWKAAAEAGDGEAQYNLGLLLAKGQGCVKDVRAAFGWFALAAEHGIKQAQSRLAILYAGGEGVAPDPIEAHKWFVIASRAGDTAARANRTQSETHLTAAQLDEAVRRADAWAAGRRAVADQPPR